MNTASKVFFFGSGTLCGMDKSTPPSTAKTDSGDRPSAIISSRSGATVVKIISASRKVRW